MLVNLKFPVPVVNVDIFCASEVMRASVLTVTALYGSAIKVQVLSTTGHVLEVTPFSFRSFYVQRGVWAIKRHFLNRSDAFNVGG